MNLQNMIKGCRKFSDGGTDVHDEKGSGSPFFISGDLLHEIEEEIHENLSVTIREVASHHSRSAQDHNS